MIISKMSKRLPRLKSPAFGAAGGRRVFGLLATLLALAVAGRASRAATIVVNSAGDPAGFNANITIAQLGSTVTLRDALNAAGNAGGANTITFNPSLAGATVLLTNAQRTDFGPTSTTISSILTIQGLTGNSGVNISGGGQVRLFLISGGSLTLNDLTLSDGAPGNSSGGAVYGLGGTLLANRCTFQHNSGAAIFLDTRGNTFSLVNCTLAQNSGIYGGALSVNDPIGVATLRNVTVVGNYASQLGGGLDCFLGSLLLTNTIVAGNSAANNDADISGHTAGAGNLIGSSTGLIGITNGVDGNIVTGAYSYSSPSPALGALTNNGGPTPTFLPQVSSAVFNAGVADTGVTTDQRGLPRPQGPATDIGAIELQYQSPVITGAAGALFYLGQTNSFTIATTGVPAPAFSFTGTLPSGVTLSTAGVLSGTPAVGSVGSYSITITAANGQLPDRTQNFTLSVSEAPSLVVTTTNDVVNNLDGVTSLREALTYAASLSGPQTITFDPGLRGQTITLHDGWTGSGDSSALVVNGNLTVQGLSGSPGIVIAVDASVQRRHFYVASGASLTLQNLTFTGGRAPDYGGSVWDQFGTLTVRGCTFTGNYSGVEGGAIQVWGGSPSALIEDSTISGNSSGGDAGAMDLGALTNTLHNVTVTDDSATNGYAVVFYQYPVTAIDTLIARNPNGDVGSANGGAFDPFNSLNNLIGNGGSAGLVNGVNGNLVGVTVSNLFIGSLADNGGPTPTIALTASSPAVNAGITVSGLTIDQRGLPRAVRQPDIGAYEFQTPVVIVNSTNDPAGFNPGITVATLGATITFRDAFNAAVNTGGNNIITFARALAGQTVGLSQLGDSGTSSALTMGNRSAQSTLTIQGLTGTNGITIAATGTNQMRLFLCGVSGQLDDVTFNDLILTGGVAPNGNWGGAIEEVGAYLTLNRCTLTGNSATLGGALFNQLGVINATDCTIANNSADLQEGQGGGIYQASGAQVTLQNCTITGNQAAQGAGYCAVGTPYPMLVNTIIANNHETINLPEIYGRVNAASHNNLCSDPGTTAGSENGAGNMQNGVNGNILGVNPLLGTLGDYGGPVPTIPLLLGSPAINTGASIGLAIDERGFPLLGQPDIGAFEYQGPSITSAAGVTFLTGLANSFALTATSAVSPTAISIAGALPTGVGFFLPGTLAGTPPAGSGGIYPLTVTASNGVASAGTQNFVLSILEPDVFAAHPNFNTNGLGWALNGDSVNGGPAIAGNSFAATDGSGGENRSAWFRYPLYVGGFQASFTYQDIGGGGADGMAFVIQDSAAGAAALGAPGGGLGYVGINQSVALLLNIYGGSPGGASGLLVATNGLGNGSGYSSGVYQGTAPVDVDAGNPVQVNLRYIGGRLQVALTDTVTGASYSTNIALDITSFVGTNTAYVGFTGSEGGISSHQTVSNFSYVPLPLLGVGKNAGLTLSWPLSAYGFRLQAAAILSGQSWTNVPTAATQAANQNQVILPATGRSMFYRLVLAN